MSTAVRRLGSLGLLLVVSVAACRPGPWDPVGVGGAVAPFHRLPYVQAVDTSGAVVLWRAGPTARDSFRFRIEGEPDWRTAAVERVRAGVEAAARGTPSGRALDRRVRLDRLPPGTAIEYVVVADSVALAPSVFRTAPRAGAGPVRVLAFGDSGWGSEDQVRLAGLMEARAWDLAIHVGDIAYPRGTERDFTVRHFRVYADLLARVPFFPSPGNHDIETDGGRPYDRGFEWPEPRPGARYYTFRWGPVRFFALDTSSEGVADALRRRSGAQYAWLSAALDSARREAGVRWLVAYLHHPLYSQATGFAGKGADWRLRNALVPLFERHGVDVVLSGHDHHYQRTHPILDGRPEAAGCGPVYLVTGGGGASLFARGVAPPSPLTAAVARVHHFVGLRFDADVVTGRVLDVRGEVVDDFVIGPFDGTAAPAPPRCS